MELTCNSRRLLLQSFYKICSARYQHTSSSCFPDGIENTSKVISRGTNTLNNGQHNLSKSSKTQKPFRDMFVADGGIDSTNSGVRNGSLKLYMPCSNCMVIWKPTDYNWQSQKRQNFPPQTWQFRWIAARNARERDTKVSGLFYSIQTCEIRNTFKRYIQKKLAIMPAFIMFLVKSWFSNDLCFNMSFCNLQWRYSYVLINIQEQVWTFLKYWCCFPPWPKYQHLRYSPFHKRHTCICHAEISLSS